MNEIGWVADSYRQRIINWIDGARQLSTPFAFITKGIIQLLTTCSFLDHDFTLKRMCAHLNIRRRAERSSKYAAQVRDVNDCRMFVATWNVARKSPTSSLNLEDWLHTSPPADIYVLGFQGIVPLNAGNVLGTEDNGPAKKWLALIRRTLDNLLGTGDDSNLELDSDFEESTEKNQSFSNRPSIQSLSHNMMINNNNTGTRQPRLERRYSVSDRMVVRNQFDGYDPDLGYNGSDVSPDSIVNSEMTFET
ncbi:type I inositol polyphosphate 5-phosphatase 4-like protein [Tanacetum coccineum]